MNAARSARRILMTTDAVGGVWQYALDLAGELGALGDRVTLAVLGPGLTPAQREQAGRVAGLDLVETGEALDWLADGPKPVERAARAIARLARDTGADLVHCNSPALAGANDFTNALPAPVLVAAHGCVASWWRAVRREPLAAEFGWHYEMSRRGLLAAETVVAPSASFAEQIRDTYALPAVPLAIHNGRRARLLVARRARPWTQH